MDDFKPHLSIVIPRYNATATLPAIQQHHGLRFANPPSEALKLLGVAESQKCDVIYGIYERKEHAWWRNAGNWLTNRIADFVVEKPRKLYLCSFRCLSVVPEYARSNLIPS